MVSFASAHTLLRISQKYDMLFLINDANEVGGLKCAFFGNRDAPEEVYEILKQTIIKLVEKEKVTEFFVGTHGRFDKMVYAVLRELQPSYGFQFNVVLAYLNRGEYSPKETLYPEGIEKVPLRYAIVWRNRWMIDRSDYVVTYTKQTTGGAWMMKELAQKKKKRIIELA